MTRRRLLFICLLTTLHLALGWWLGQREMFTRQRQEAEAMAHTLDRVLPGSTALLFGKKLAHSLFERFHGSTPSPGEVRRLRDQVDRRFGRGAVEIVLLNASETPLVAVPASSTYQETMRKMLGGGWLPRYGLRVPRWRCDRIREAPQYLGVWRSASVGQTSGVAQVLIIIDLRLVTQERLFHLSIERLRARGLNAGLYNRLLPERSNLPGLIHPDEIQARFIQGTGGTDEIVARGSDLLVLAPRLGSTVFLGVVPARAVPLPGWMIGALLAWLVPALLSGMRGSELPSISMFLGATFGVAAGVPLLMAVLFWSVFEDNRVASMTSELLTSMEGDLIETENGFLSFLRRREVQYQRLIRELEQGFQQGPEAASQAMNLVSRLELLNVLDHFYLIDAKGRHLRDYCALTPQLRRLYPLSLPVRLRRMQKLIDLGYDMEEREVAIVQKLTIDVSCLALSWTFQVTQDVHRRVMEGVGAIGREQIRRFNERAVIDSPGGEEDRSSLVTGSVLESQTGDLMRNVYSSLGRFIRAGSGTVQSRALLDILRDTEGRGKHCAFIFTDMRSLENTFLHELMHHRERWPAGLRYFSESGFGFAVFPESLPRRAFRFLEDALTPPRRLYSNVVTLNGQKALLAGLAGRHLVNYFLVGVRSWDEIEAYTRELQRQMAVIGLLMALLIGVIILRLRSTVIRPAAALQNGIRAMERKDFEHRIPLMTGDEWDELATAFNHTLEGMEELEVTRVLRTRLLPAGPIAGGGGVFQGRSLASGDVGGDYYDAALRPDGGFAFFVGDAPGSGVSAALVTAMVKSAFLILLRAGVSSPAALLDKLNRLLLNHLSKRQSMSCMAGFAEADGRITIAGAGFRDPRTVKPGRSPKIIRLGGTPLGLSAETVFENNELVLEDDGMLILTTAGVVDAVSPDGEIFGNTRLDEVLRSIGHLPPDRLITGVQTAWMNHTTTGRWSDDATLAIFSRGRNSPD